MKNTNRTERPERTQTDSLYLAMHTWNSALKYTWRKAFQLDRSQFVIARSLISTLGFILPLALGVLSKHIIIGVSIASGAASLGTVGLNVDYSTRIRTMMFASLGVAISACIGALVGPYVWLSILIIALWSFGTGLLIVINQNMMIIGLQSTLALIILTHFTLSPLQALLQALLMLIGALIQTLLSVGLFWQRIGTDQTLLANIYQGLADYAEDPHDIYTIRSLTDMVKSSDDTIHKNKSQRKKIKVLRNLFEQAEHIRLTLAILADIFQEWTELNDEQGTIAQETRNILHGIAEILRDISEDILLDRPQNDQSKLYEKLDNTVIKIAKHTINQNSNELPMTYKALRTYLRTADKLTRTVHKNGTAFSWKNLMPHHPRHQNWNSMEIFRANLNMKSTAFRHAIRLAIVMALCAMLYRLTPLERGYWIPISAIFVLRPDFFGTFTRGISQLVGTILGALTVTLLLRILPATPTVLVYSETIVTFFAYAVLFVNYSLFSFFVTIQIILLLTFIDTNSQNIEIDRVIGTIIGGALALAVYAVWPTWENLRIAENIAKRLDALRNYGIKIMGAYIHPDSYDEATIIDARRESRLMRSSAEASINQVLTEPMPSPISEATAHCILIAADQIGQNLISLEAYLFDISLCIQIPALTPFAQAMGAALTAFSTSIRNQQPVGSLPDWQAAIQNLEEERKLLRKQDRAACTAYSELNFVLFEAKRIAAIMETMNRLLGKEFTSQHE